MSLLMYANNMAFWILKYRKELTTFEEFKSRSKFTLTSQWNAAMFTTMVNDGINDDLTSIAQWVQNSLDKDGHDESYYIND